MRSSLVSRFFQALFLARDAWITVAIAAAVLVLIPQGRELLGETALASGYVWGATATTFWSLSALHFTLRAYRYLQPERHRDAIHRGVAAAMAFVAGLLPIALVSTGMHIALPAGLITANQVTVPAVSLAAYLAIVLAAWVIWRVLIAAGLPARGFAALGVGLIVLCLIPGTVLAVLGFFLPIATGRLLGSYALFAFWAGTAMPILYLLRKLSWRTGMPVTGMLVFVALVIAAVVPERERGHEVRALASGYDPGERADLETALQLWQASQPGDGPATMILLAAPGGGIVSALWTGKTLSRLRHAYGETFVRNLFAVSAVSGGAVGAALYADAAGPELADCLLAPVQNDDRSERPSVKFEDALTEFSAADHIAPVALRLMFLNDSVSPYADIGELQDRSAILERSWELAWQSAVANQDCHALHEPSLGGSYLARWYRRQGDGMALIEPWQGVPYLLLTGTSLTSGRRMVTAPFAFPAQPAMLRTEAADVVRERIARVNSLALDLFALSSFDLRLSTTANNAARFPWIEPAGRVEITADIDRDYDYDLIVDGGYFDVSGAHTLRDLIADIVEICRASSCRPLRLLVIQINSDPHRIPVAYASSRAPDREPPGLWGALLTPLYGGLVTVSSNANNAALRLRSYTEELPLLTDSPIVESLFVELPIPSPLRLQAWVMSDETSLRMSEIVDRHLACAFDRNHPRCSILTADNVDGPPSTSPDALDLLRLRHVVLKQSAACIDTFLGKRTDETCYGIVRSR